MLQLEKLFGRPTILVTSQRSAEPPLLVAISVLDLHRGHTVLGEGVEGWTQRLL